MRRMFFIALFQALLVLIAGCNSGANPSGRKAVEVKGAQKDALLKLITAENIDFNPNSVGKLVFSGDIANRSNQHIAEVEFSLETIAADGTRQTLAKGKAENIFPQSVRSFSVTTKLGLGEAPQDYEVRITKIKIFK